VIAHGMLIMGFVGQAITRWVPDRSLRKFKVRFSGITRPGDVITVSGRVTGKRSERGRGIVTCEVAAKNQKGETKVTGEFEAELPTRTAA
jgi:acyl dehydratase